MTTRFVRFVIAAILGLLLLGVRPSSAQTVQVVTPANVFGFTPSADHNVSDNGVARVTSYAVMFCPSIQVVGGAVCVAPQVVNIGKPTPDATNAITTAPIRSMIGPNMAWIAFVEAIGPGGTGVDPTGVGPFSYPQPPAPATGFSIR